MSTFWYKPCSKCRSQGRLVVHKYMDDKSLFLCCDECMACWKTPQDADLSINGFREFNIKSDYDVATEEDIEQSGWDLSLFREYKN